MVTLNLPIDILTSLKNSYNNESLIVKKDIYYKELREVNILKQKEKEDVNSVQNPIAISKYVLVPNVCTVEINVIE